MVDPHQTSSARGVLSGFTLFANTFPLGSAFQGVNTKWSFIAVSLNLSLALRMFSGGLRVPQS